MDLPAAMKALSISEGLPTSRKLGFRMVRAVDAAARKEMTSDEAYMMTRVGSEKGFKEERRRRRRRS